MARTTERNRSRVPLAQWKRWCGVARRVFNETHATLSYNADLFQHPGAPRPKPLHWKTLAWNAAWVAADAAQTALEDISRGK